jgi:hypothetical protein
MDGMYPSQDRTYDLQEAKPTYVYTTRLKKKKAIAVARCRTCTGSSLDRK